jgi:hypothetical protein
MANVFKTKRPEVDFEKYSTDPTEWRNVSRRLFGTAEVIWPLLKQSLQTHPGDRLSARREALNDHFGGYFLLAGCAVENALKARIVEQLGPEVGAERLRKEVFEHKHDCVKLAKRHNSNSRTQNAACWSD